MNIILYGMKSLQNKLLLIIALLSCVVFVSCSYGSDYDYAEFLDGLPENIKIEQKYNSLIVTPDEFSSAFVFYPGAYVSYEAYLPMIVKCAQEGIKCFIVNMPSDLALFNISAADKFQRKFEDIEHWYVGGHSLGGAMAASYISRHENDYDGLIMMAAFSTTDISDKNLKVLSIYGSEDGVLGLEKYNECKSNLPKTFEEYKIEGGNHSQFGSYGLQDGDNEAKITAEEQWKLTAECVGKFINNK